MKKLKINKELFLTLAVLLIAFVIYFIDIDVNEKLAVGSIFAAAGSFVSIIWFYSSLQQQSIQLEEQRKQFKLENRTKIIATAKTILDDMENEINNLLKCKFIKTHRTCQNVSTQGSPPTLTELPDLFYDCVMQFGLLHKVISGSVLNLRGDHYRRYLVRNVVRNADEFYYNAMLEPIERFLFSIKDVGILFLENDGIEIKDSNELWQFIIDYRELLKDKPIISKYLPIITKLLIHFNGEIFVSKKTEDDGEEENWECKKVAVKIAMKAVPIAEKVALALQKNLNEPERYLKEKELLEAILDFREKHDFLPKIAEKWLETHKKL
jgi:uncharacterized protein (UPF0333 family)